MELFFFTTGKPVMIVTEYMENGSLDSFLRVSNNTDRRVQSLCPERFIMHHSGTVHTQRQQGGYILDG